MIVIYQKKGFSVSAHRHRSIQSLHHLH